jgi:uncharacterized protein Yka (UPF0111/DUF47 family)
LCYRRRVRGHTETVVRQRVGATSVGEFYRRISAISDDIVTVADRIWYSEVKES